MLIMPIFFSRNFASKQIEKPVNNFMIYVIYDDIVRARSLRFVYHKEWKQFLTFTENYHLGKTYNKNQIFGNIFSI